MRRPSIFFVALLAFATSLSSCGRAVADDTSTIPLSTTITTEALGRAISGVESSINQMSLRVAIIDSADLSLAWADLNSDILSSLRDLERDASSVDIEGLRNRIDKFRDRFRIENEPAWDQFVNSVDAFADELGSVSSQ